MLKSLTYEGKISLKLFLKFRNEFTYESVFILVKNRKVKPDCLLKSKE